MSKIEERTSIPLEEVVFYPCLECKQKMKDYDYSWVAK